MKYTIHNIIFPDPTVCCETKMYYVARGQITQNIPLLSYRFTVEGCCPI